MAGDSSDITWNVDMEVNLFHAMRGHKPAGVNRHFQMIAIHDRLSSTNKKISSSDVWNHLSTLYDLQALNESEIVPFPNKNGDFDIPESDKSDLGEKSFPRTAYINMPSPEASKTEAKANKPGKQDTKTSQQTPKNESKSDSKLSGAKSENRSSTPASRGDQKSGHSSSSKSGTQHSTSSNTAEPSPKRAKRTRNVPSTNASPATPTEPPTKRRR